MTVDHDTAELVLHLVQLYLEAELDPKHTPAMLFWLLDQLRTRP